MVAKVGHALLSSYFANCSIAVPTTLPPTPDPNTVDLPFQSHKSSSTNPPSTARESTSLITVPKLKVPQNRLDFVNTSPKSPTPDGSKLTEQHSFTVPVVETFNPVLRGAAAADQARYEKLWTSHQKSELAHPLESQPSVATSLYSSKRLRLQTFEEMISERQDQAFQLEMEALEKNISIFMREQVVSHRERMLEHEVAKVRAEEAEVSRKQVELVQREKLVVQREERQRKEELSAAARKTRDDEELDMKFAVLIKLEDLFKKNGAKLVADRAAFVKEKREEMLFAKNRQAERWAEQIKLDRGKAKLMLDMDVFEKTKARFGRSIGRNR
ncbi:hypothetical protein BJ508DRAFT_116172 [Ascobolus immersus RN42]|uniref:Uncharacterized protein n=1 Tax=Ascobolus immersus RN42 TaxID=1160509 RepID=A0A3N4II17_ASCIM|nr:hypothetical protein BJ508DRAFT_116172 [Ascobolus immersus RN42]